MDTTIASLTGIILGGFLLFYAYRCTERKRYQHTLRLQAYTDYINCISEYEHAHYSRLSNEARILNIRTMDAKLRICLYGSPHVVEECAKFERLGALMSTDEQSTAFTRLVSAMRKDAIRESAKTNTLNTIILGKISGRH